MESNDEKHEEPVEKDAVTDEMVEEPGQFDCFRRLISETIHGAYQFLIPTALATIF